MYTVDLPPVLTMAEARVVMAQLEPALGADPAPVVDASPLVTLDTAALAVLLQCSRLATAAGNTLTVRGAPAKLSELARLYGVDALLGL